MLSQTPRTSSSPQQPSTPPADNARRIGAKEAHDLWEKGDAIVIDTRAESLYKDGHIKGSISMPQPGTVLARVDELPRNKLIIAYCT
jgi:rhodanese-related sulfurtransferase